MLTETVDVNEAQAKFKDLVHRVVTGIHIVLSENHKPIAHIMPAKTRLSGLHSGAIKTTPDFDTPLPEEFWSNDK